MEPDDLFKLSQNLLFGLDSSDVEVNANVPSELLGVLWRREVERVDLLGAIKS